MISGRLRCSWKVIARYWDGGSQYREVGDGDDGLDFYRHGFENNELGSREEEDEANLSSLVRSVSVAWAAGLSGERMYPDLSEVCIQ